MLKLTIVLFLVGVIQQGHLAPTIDSDLVQRLQKGSTLNVFVILADSTQPLLNDLANQVFDGREARLNAVNVALKSFTSNSQQNVVQYLKEQQQTMPLTFRPYWIDNQIYVQNANLDLVLNLAKFTEVASIVEDELFPLDEPLDLILYDNLPPHDDEPQWGVKMVQAPEVWAAGNKGEKIVICTIDTGVRWTHEALRSNFRSDYGWYDPGEETPEPNDQNGHGTHTTGTIAGTARMVGVAPATQWIACKGCATSSCSRSDLTACAEWVACPTDTKGENPDCSKAPHLVSNSWGGGRGDEWYYQLVQAWRTAGIIPLFSQGNSGPSCGSAGSPGDYDNLIGVGSTDITDKLSYFSSVGPTTIGARMKPDVAAPGSNVFSSHHLSDTAYASMSGTSMASPHAAGAVALILADSQVKNVTLEYDQVKEILQAGGELTTSTGKNCGGVSEETLPNHHVGHGRINAFRSTTANK